MPEVQRIKTKVCLVGEAAVGKTSMVRRFVQDEFDDRYITTLGAKVSKREMTFDTPDHAQIHMDMTIWDIMGEKGFRDLLKDAYFYGANGILAVADITRRRTLDDLDDWIDGVEQVVGNVPLLLAVNKTDLTSGAQFTERDVAQFAKAYGCEFLLASAKTGDRVEDAFLRIGTLVAEHQLDLE